MLSRKCAKETVLPVFDIIQSIVTIAAVVLGGVWAYFKLHTFRDFEPHLTISQEVSHRSISDGYVHLFVQTTLRNSSKVRVEIREANFRLQRMGPLANEEVERLYAEVFIDRKEDSIQWTSYDEATRIWSKGEMTIEPGESYHEPYEFIVSNEIESVIVYAFFHNSQYRKYPAQGWAATTVHDIIVR